MCLFKYKYLKYSVLLFLTFLDFQIYAQKNQTIAAILSKDTSGILKEIVQNPSKYRLKICYSDSEESLFFRTQKQEYFYPASTVKLLFAVFAAEKLSHLAIPVNASFIYQKDLFTNQIDSLKKYNIQIEYYKMLTVSDNKSANFFYDIANLEYMRKRISELGYTKSNITQRFSKADILRNRIHAGIVFLDSNNQYIAKIDSNISSASCSQPNTFSCLVGKSHIENGKKINTPYDFAIENYFDLEEMHTFFQKFKNDTNRVVFSMNQEYRNLILSALSSYPNECKLYLGEKKDEFYDYCRKYLLVGAKDVPKDSCLSITNKVGLSYGFLTDVAFIQNNCENVSFYLTASVYVNPNEVINDGKYNYDLGMKILKRIGEMFYEFRKSKLSH